MSDLSGMTGFGRAAGEAAWGSWSWEAKSVNGRGLDIRINIPSGFEGLDQTLKKTAGRLFRRGSLQLSLRMDVAAGTDAAINAPLLDLLSATYAKRSGQAPSGDALATLIAARGVLETDGGASLRDLGKRDDVRETLLASALQALDHLKQARKDEGQALHNVLTRLLGDMQDQKNHAERHAAEQPGLVKTRLETRLKELAADKSVDAERLAAEVAVTAAKADVREELDRLAAHIETGRGLIASAEPVGRKLDFLAQELNREANTLCSKSASLALTQAGLALKSLIDQFKEQAANVE